MILKNFYSKFLGVIFIGCFITAMIYALSFQTIPASMQAHFQVIIQDESITQQIRTFTVNTLADDVQIFEIEKIRLALTNDACDADNLSAWQSFMAHMLSGVIGISGYPNFFNKREEYKFVMNLYSDIKTQCV